MIEYSIDVNSIINNMFLPLDLSLVKRIWLFVSSKSLFFSPSIFVSVFEKRLQSWVSHSWYFLEDFIPSRPNFKKANLLCFSSCTSVLKSSGGVSWCFPMPPFSSKYSLKIFFCKLTCLLMKSCMSFLKYCFDLQLSSWERPKNLIASDLNFSSETLPLRRPSWCHSSVSPFVRGMTYLVELCVLIKFKLNENHWPWNHFHFSFHSHFTPCLDWA